MDTAAPLPRARLVAQSLTSPRSSTPVETVASFGAMQGQDLLGVLASVALRSTGDIADVLDDLSARRLVRGYPMRGTVFLMAAEDLAWVTGLCAAPSLRAAAARRHQLGLDAEQLHRARGIVEEVLASGPMARGDLFDVWEGAGLAPAGGRGYHLLFSLIAGGVCAYGPWNGADQDVVLVGQWLPGTAGLEEVFAGERLPAVAELLLRYLTSRGPATLRDFAWWTKLTLTEIRKALPLIAHRLDSDGADEPSFWRPGLFDEVAAAGRATGRALLLPGFDEYILGYRDRLFAMQAGHHARLVPGNNGVFKKTVVIGGRVLGTWSRGGRPGRRVLQVEEFEPISATARKALQVRFAAFPFIGG